jgi:AraC-like DNA-binding protein
MRASTVDAYVRDPIGRYVAGSWYVVWVDSPRLAGAAFFGRPDARDLPTVARVTTLPQTWSDPNGYDILVDWSSIDGLDPLAFTGLSTHLKRVLDTTIRLRRAAVVRPPGMTGAIVAGVFHEDVPRSRAALFTDRVEAVAWLGLAGDVRKRVEHLLDHHCAAPPFLQALRDRLARRGGATLASEARALGLSERTLSRQLHEAGTSFRAELERARVRAAEALLVDTELKLDAVARQVGFASRTHFSQFFRRATGESPSEFRARRR